MLILLAVSACASGNPATREPYPPTLIPAYAHNDYENDQPLKDALELGYRGVEVDYFVIDGELQVGHDRGECRPFRTLQSLYLDPLREVIRNRGSVLPDGSTFLLNIESKEKGESTYTALHEVLAGYEDILTVVRDGEVEPGPVQVVLVGWFPTLEDLANQPVRYAAVQSYFDQLPADHADLPAHLLKLISLKYSDTFDWNGKGDPPQQFQRRLAEITAARDEVPGRWLRAFQVPGRAAAYAALLDGGVDLIGTKTLIKSRKILLEIQTPAAKVDLK